MIEINGVCHTYDRDPVLEDLTLQLPRGRVTSLVGPNGAGKSTLLSVIARLLTPDSGQVLVDGLADFGASRRAALLEAGEPVTKPSDRKPSSRRRASST